MNANTFRAAGLAAGLALAGCVSTPTVEHEAPRPHTLTRNEVRQVEEAMRRELRNSDALLSVLKAAEEPSGSIIVCGWANLRDDFPQFVRYIGHRPFAARYRPTQAGLRDFRIVHFAMVKSEAPPVYLYCSQRGIAL